MAAFFFASLLSLGSCIKMPEPQGSKYLVLVEMTASDCQDCQDIHAIMQNLKPHYKDKIKFITLNLSGTPSKLRARETGRQFNGEEFVKHYQDRPGTVAIVSALNGHKIGVLQDCLNEMQYRKMIDEALKQVPKD